MAETAAIDKLVLPAYAGMIRSRTLARPRTWPCSPRMRG